MHSTFLTFAFGMSMKLKQAHRKWHVHFYTPSGICVPSFCWRYTLFPFFPAIILSFLPQIICLLFFFLLIHLLSKFLLLPITGSLFPVVTIHASSSTFESLNALYLHDMPALNAANAMTEGCAFGGVCISRQ